MKIVAPIRQLDEIAALATLTRERGLRLQAGSHAAEFDREAGHAAAEQVAHAPVGARGDDDVLTPDGHAAESLLVAIVGVAVRFGGGAEQFESRARFEGQHLGVALRRRGRAANRAFDHSQVGVDAAGIDRMQVAAGGGSGGGGRQREDEYGDCGRRRATRFQKRHSYSRIKTNITYLSTLEVNKSYPTITLTLM